MERYDDSERIQERGVQTNRESNHQDSTPPCMKGRSTRLENSETVFELMGPDDHLRESRVRGVRIPERSEEARGSCTSSVG